MTPEERAKTLVDRMKTELLVENIKAEIEGALRDLLSQIGRPAVCSAAISNTVAGEIRMASCDCARDSSPRVRRPTRRASPSTLQTQTWVSSRSTCQSRLMSYSSSSGSRGRW